MTLAEIQEALTETLGLVLGGRYRDLACLPPFVAPEAQYLNVLVLPFIGLHKRILQKQHPPPMGTALVGTLAKSDEASDRRLPHGMHHGVVAGRVLFGELRRWLFPWYLWQRLGHRA